IMKIKDRFVLVALIMALITLPTTTALARRGDSGYDGGISSGDTQNAQMQYQEMCFITGKPMLLKGTLAIRKSIRQDSIVSTYTYNLRNVDLQVTLNRVLTFETIVEQRSDGQKIEQTSLSRNPIETIRVGEDTYVLSNYEFSHSI